MINDERYFVEEVEGETLVFDRSNARCHCLNRLAASVWRMTQEKGATAAELARRVGEELGETVDETMVTLALARLRDAGLLESGVAASAASGLSRRQLVRRAAAVAGALSLPTVTSIVAPLPASAQTNNCDGQTNSELCAMLTCPEGQSCNFPEAQGDPCFCA